MGYPVGIHDLPVELLIFIFQLSFALTNLQQDRCRLSLVCRYWRDIVQESPYLWTDISGHDDLPYIRRSIAKSRDLPIDVYHLRSSPSRAKIYLHEYLEELLPQVSRCRSICLRSNPSGLDSSVVKPLFVGLHSEPVPRLEALTLRGSGSQRRGYGPGTSPLQLPMTLFPNLHRLEIDGVPSEVCPPGLPPHHFLSLSLVDVINVTMEQLLDVLRASPSLERLELGRSPAECPSQTTVTPIQLPRLMALHLIFMPVSVSNFLLTTIHAPNCSELLISSHFPKFVDDPVRGFLFTSSTKHFSPVIQALLTRGRNKDIDITRSDAQTIEFLLNFRDEDCDDLLDHGVLRLEFGLHSVQQVEQTVRWLVHHVEPNAPKIPVRLFLFKWQEVNLVDILDSHMAVTHFAFRILDDPDAIKPNPILVHMARPTLSRWPLPEMVDFIYGIAEEDKLQDEAALKMLRDRYGSSGVNSGEGSGGSSNETLHPKPLRRVRIAVEEGESSDMLGEVEKILPAANAAFLGGDDSLW